MTATARGIALQALARIDDGAYANLVLPGLLERSGLDARDRAFVTELVYGTTRMRRSCDFLVDRFLMREVEPMIRRALRLGAYQLHHLATPPHAAVSATVAEVRGPGRGLANAVLRKVAAAPPPTWPDLATELSYPDWIVERLMDDLGAEDAESALRAMNVPGTVSVREDDYVQDRSSQDVVAAVSAGAGMRVVDLCAAPGGKATGLAASVGVTGVVAAGDVNLTRLGLVVANSARLGADMRLAPFAADARLPPLRPGLFDRVLVDAPCSGLGVLGRRPDARFRIQAEDVERLANLQRSILTAAAPLVRPGGLLVYSVCTMTTAETTDVDRWFAEQAPDLVPVEESQSMPDWRASGRGFVLLPQGGHDGMFVVTTRRRSPVK